MISTTCFLIYEDYDAPFFCGAWGKDKEHVKSAEEVQEEEGTREEGS